MQHKLQLWNKGVYLLGTFGTGGIDVDQIFQLLSSQSQTIHNIFIEQKDDIKPSTYPAALSVATTADDFGPVVVRQVDQSVEMLLPRSQSICDVIYIE